MHGDRIGQVHPSSTIDQYYLHRRPHCTDRRQWYDLYHQLHSKLSSVSSEPLRQETDLKTSLSCPSPYVMITSRRIHFAVIIKEIFLVFIITLVATGSCNDMIKDNNHVKLLGQSAATKSTQSFSSHNPYHKLYHSSSAMSSTNSSSAAASFLSSIPEPLPLHSEQRTSVNLVQNDQSETKANILNLLISSLEQLHVLNKTDMSCFRLDKITISNNEYPPSTFSSTLQSSAPGQKTVGVHMYFLELPHSTPGVEHSKPSNHHSTSSNRYSTSSNQHLMKSNQQPEASLKPDDRSHPSSGSMIVTHNSCVSDPVIEVHRETVNSYTQEGKGQSVSHRHADIQPPRIHEYSTVPAGGLSRTQIVVVSTCSGIIGMFFLIAAFLRLRNYIKRLRMEQEMARRPKFRSCSVALRGATQSMEQLRRDSVASHASRQNSPLTQGSDNLSGSQRELSANSLRYNPDQAPLLINSKSVQALDASALADSHPSLKYIDEISMTPKKKDIPSSLVTNNNNNNNTKKYIPKEACLVHQAEMSLGRSNLLARDPGSLTNKANIPNASNKHCRFSANNIAGHLRPVPSTGSFKGRVLEAAVSPDVVQLQMVPRLRWFRVAGDRSPETIFGLFTKSGSTGQIGEHNTSNPHSKLVLDFGIKAENAGAGLATDRISGTQSKKTIATDIVRDEPRLIQALFGYSSEEAAHVHLHNLDTELGILEQDLQDEAAKGTTADKVSTNLKISSSGVFAGTESGTNMACVADQNHDCFHGTENFGQDSRVEFTTIPLKPQTEMQEMNAVHGVHEEPDVVHENTKPLTQNEDVLSHGEDAEHSV